jgi:hypothetical protein
MPGPSGQKGDAARAGPSADGKDRTSSFPAMEKGCRQGDGAMKRLASSPGPMQTADDARGEQSGQERTARLNRGQIKRSSARRGSANRRGSGKTHFGVQRKGEALPGTKRASRDDVLGELDGERASGRRRCHRREREWPSASRDGRQQ